MSSTVGYFSMEVALEPAMPTYAGGLGVLAGTPSARPPTWACRWWP